MSRKEINKRIKAREFPFSEVTGYRMTDRKCHDDIPEELEITYIINEVIKRLLK
jgi:hypothetical protein